MTAAGWLELMQWYVTIDNLSVVHLPLASYLSHWTQHRFCLRLGSHQEKVTRMVRVVDFLFLVLDRSTIRNDFVAVVMVANSLFDCGLVKEAVTVFAVITRGRPEAHLVLKCLLLKSVVFLIIVRTTQFVIYDLDGNYLSSRAVIRGCHGVYILFELH